MTRTTNKPKWLFVNDSPHVGIKCSNCGHLLGSNYVIFGKHGYKKCPNCECDMETLSDDIYEMLLADVERQIY